GRGLGRQTMPETLAYSTVMAIHTLWLAARAENIGLGWVSILDPERMGTILNAPKGWHFTAYLCVGYAEGADDTPLLHRVGWQGNAATVWGEV
ncbi:MAG: nitroreductase family protein, partial [Paracoccus sp. (in: a-proteobacteria)]|nr:nitroreductase family protein [Paracoccus sp. (in: a-proteobacteria)]